VRSGMQIRLDQKSIMLMYSFLMQDGSNTTTNSRITLALLTRCLPKSWTTRSILGGKSMFFTETHSLRLTHCALTHSLKQREYPSIFAQLHTWTFRLSTPLHTVGARQDVTKKASFPTKSWSILGVKAAGKKVLFPTRSWSWYILGR
jgi:hypothetical protein